MEHNIIGFINILAWFGMVLGAFVTVVAFYAQMTYEGSLKQQLHAIKGYRVDYTARVGRWIVLFVVCLAWLIAM